MPAQKKKVKEKPKAKKTAKKPGKKMTKPAEEPKKVETATSEASAANPTSTATTPTDVSAQPSPFPASDLVPGAQAAPAPASTNTSAVEGEKTESTTPVAPTSAPVFSPNQPVDFSPLPAAETASTPEERQQAASLQQTPADGTNVQPLLSSPVQANGNDIVEVKKQIKWGIILLILVVLIGAVAVLYFLFVQKKFGLPAASTPTPTPIEKKTEVPTPTAEAKIDLSKYNIKVLNGSGTSGEAAKAKTLLEDAGFSVTSIGNADKSNYEKTEIQANKDVDKNFITALQKGLEKTYAVKIATASSNLLNDTDVTVIIGSSKK